ncbi:MAG: hypothetical protein ABMA14_19505 [Hyphomonadaceae bacterium]
MGRITGIGMAAVAALLLAAPALACSPMPFPPMPEAPAGTSAEDVAALQRAWSASNAASRAIEDRDWQMKQQSNLFDMSKSLVIVRYDRQEPAGKTASGANWRDGEPSAVLKPVRWVKGHGVKGQGAATEMKLGMSDPPPCGQMRGHAAYYGKPGDVFLVYLSGDVLTQKDVLEAYAIDRIMDSRTLAALNAR